MTVEWINSCLSKQVSLFLFFFFRDMSTTDVFLQALSNLILLNCFSSEIQFFLKVLVRNLIHFWNLCYWGKRLNRFVEILIRTADQLRFVSKQICQQVCPKYKHRSRKGEWEILFSSSHSYLFPSALQFFFTQTSHSVSF